MCFGAKILRDQRHSHVKSVQNLIQCVSKLYYSLIDNGLVHYFIYIRTSLRATRHRDLLLLFNIICSRHLKIKQILSVMNK